MQTWWLIIGMLAITFAIRYGLFAFPGLRFPPLVRQALHYVPSAVLTAIVVPGMLLPQGVWAFNAENAYLLAGLLTILIAALSRHLLLTIGGGLLAFFLLRWAMGQLPL
ncbi:AzlD domain-containing protein [Stutzerimonas kirkiae]|uniref:Branched-chain amino acid transport n=1 Tax=Stutzerimonas kirkiae TaxID=2211392 RepID=A0A4Q9RB66_9GAMM|nr:AzlD domain-containing protein [Stutzerimonas kirkiae]TBU98078.1 branched-chain amino acid transport [Stutzerimonas kirkiae]TBV02901.1 branched-chain amino acid transport [Stutzerimonas kirkiae]TBV09148.1 branched-chain amino acid transport [Stutzerimonas kirkiae]TBV11129.1 branched-chain amino acid transport [Stutzerimonas kirkiae]